MARALDWDVTLVTSLSAGFDRQALQGLTLIAAAADQVARYENSYTAQGRLQRIIEPGETIGSALMARIPERTFDVAMLAPAFRELQGRPAINARLTGVALQGQLRRAAADGRILPEPDPLAASQHLIAADGYVFFSEEDALEPESLAEGLARQGAIVFVTRGRNGVSLFSAQLRRDYPTRVVDEVDPTGAGDCFAAAFLLRLAETSSLDDAVRFGLAAGALAVTGEGLSGIPNRSAIDALLERSAA